MFAQRLRLARKKAGLSMRELATRMSPSVSVQAISKYEAGKMMPSSRVLVSLGRALEVSLDFLMGGQVEALEAVEFRQRSGTSAKDRARAEVLITEQLENYLAIEYILELEPAPDPLGGLRSAPLRSLKESEDLAIQLRRDWNLGLGPIPSMTGLLESKGFKLIEADLPERFDGLACTVKLAGSRPDIEAIVVSSRAQIERRRLTLARELAERAIHSIADSDIRHEEAMNRFAQALLVPGEHLRAQAGSNRHGFTYGELVRLKHMYGVPASVMLTRLREVGVVSAAALDRAFRGYLRLWRRREPAPILSNEGLGAFEKPRRFEDLVWRGLGEQLFSPVRGAELLRRSLREVGDELRGPGLAMFQEGREEAPRTQHVVPYLGQWAVKSAGVRRPTSTHRLQAEAIAVAREIAVGSRSEVVIHDQQGRIEARTSYAALDVREASQARAALQADAPVPETASRRTA